MISSLNTGTFEHETIDSGRTVNGQRSWTLQTQKVVAKILKTETINQGVESEKVRFRFTVYINKHSDFTVMQDRLKLDGNKFYMAVGDMLNGKWVFE